MKNIDELKEQVIALYEKNYDLDLCFDLLNVEEKVQRAMEEDGMFTDRLKYISAQLKQQIIGTLIPLMDSKSEKMKYNSAIAVGKMLYPERFGDVKNEGNSRVEIVLPDNGR